MAVTDQQILTAIDEAILAIVTGKNAAMSVEGRNLQRLGLEQLQTMKREYEARIARASSAGGMFGVANMRGVE